jgi:hypothetical protein
MYLQDLDTDGRRGQAGVDSSRMVGQPDRDTIALSEERNEVQPHLLWR